MPDQDGKLSQEEKKTAEKWLTSQAPTLKCPSCGQRNFAIVDHLISPPVFYGGNVVVGGPSYPMFALVCSHCAHVLTYSAVASKVITSSSDDEAKNG